MFIVAASLLCFCAACEIIQHVGFPSGCFSLHLLHSSHFFCLSYHPVKCTSKPLCDCMCESNAIVALLARGCRTGPEQSMCLASLMFQMFKDCVCACMCVCVHALILFMKSGPRHIKMRTALPLLICC